MPSPSQPHAPQITREVLDYKLREIKDFFEAIPEQVLVGYPGEGMDIRQARGWLRRTNKLAP